MKRAIHCCNCGTPFAVNKWRAAGVLSLKVSGPGLGRQPTHYACSNCRQGKFDLMRHAGEFATKAGIECNHGDGFTSVSLGTLKSHLSNPPTNP